MINIPTITRPVRHLRRYRHIFLVFARHGFGFVLSQLPAEPSWLRELDLFPPPELTSLPAHFREALEELGPTFVKLGQMLSTRPDLLPPSYIEELTKLQDRVPPQPWPEIRQVLIAELQAPPEEIFAEVDPRPMAAASLGQVHFARLHNGDKVVIKAQRPGILDNIRTDLEIIQDLSGYAEQHTAMGRLYNLEGIAEEFADTLNNELDYRREGRNADRFRANFSDERYLYIPRVYWDYTTQRVLVLECIEGIKIDEVTALKRAGYDTQTIAGNAARIVVKEVLEDGFFHADPHPGNFLVMKNEVIGAMDFGMVGYLSDQDRADLVRLYTVSVRVDADSVVDELIHIGAAPPDVNRKALSRDLQRLLSYYKGMPLGEIRANEVLEDVLPVAFDYHLHFPTNLWLLAKTLAMMEGIGLRLDPDFDIFAFSSSTVTKLMVKMLLPNRRWLEETIRRFLVWGDFLDEIPRAGMMLVDRIEQDRPIRLTLDSVSLNRLDRLATRLALSMIVAGMTVGLAMIVPSTAESVLFVRIVVILGFVLSLALGAWVFISIIRKD